MGSELPKALRDDVRLLGEILGETLRRQESEALYQTVERVRALAKGARAGSTADFDALSDVLERMPVEEALPVARAFSHFLTLANIAEQHHRIRRRRVYERDPSAPPQIGSCDETLGRLRAGGMDPDALYTAVTTLRIELVFTAHPTEVTRRTLMQKHRRVAEWLALRDRPDLTLPEQQELAASLRSEVAAAWETSEVRRERPSPLDEVRSGLVVFEQTLWETLPHYLRVLDAALLKHTGRPLPLEATPITFGSWIGGDRDGNPAVTAAVTRTTCMLARWQALSLYLREVDALRYELSMTEASEELRARVAGADEPYRALLRGVRDRLAATIRAIEAELAGVDPGEGSTIGSVEDLAEPLRLCYRSLSACGDALIADMRLRDLLRRVFAFGLTLVRLDLRQHSQRHTEVLTAITRDLGLGAYDAWSEADRQAFLLQELQGRRPLVPSDLSASAEVREVRQLREMRHVPRVRRGLGIAS